LNDIFVEGLHNLFVRTGLERTSDMCNVILGGAENDFGPVAAWKSPQRTQEVIAVHFWHIPIEQNRIRQFPLARLECLLAVLGLDNPELQTFQDSPRYFADDAGIIDDEARLHIGLNQSQFRALLLHWPALLHRARSGSLQIQGAIGIERHKNPVVQAENAHCYAV
jgi:hypothetical protein